MSVREIAATLSDITGTRYRPLWIGSLGSVRLMIRIAKLVAPQPEAAFPPWHGMQYMRDQFSGRVRLEPLENGRYPRLGWTSIREHLFSLEAIRR